MWGTCRSVWGSGQAGWEKPRRERQKKTAVLCAEAEVCGWELWGWRWHSWANTDLRAVWYLNEPDTWKCPAHQLQVLSTMTVEFQHGVM